MVSSPMSAWKDEADLVLWRRDSSPMSAWNDRGGSCPVEEGLID